MRDARWLSEKPWRVDLLAFLGLALVLVSWALANPLSAAPDEPSHFVKAAGTVRGHGVGIEKAADDPLRYMEVPAGIARSHRLICFVFQPDVDAECETPQVADPDRLVTSITTADSYNPLYYVVVGWPTLVLDGDAALYGMRAMTALVCAAILGVAFGLARRLVAGRWVTIGLVAALTPMVVFLSGAVSPAGAEICLALVVWVAVNGLLQRAGEEGAHTYFVALCIAAALLVQLRTMSPFFLFLAVVLSVACVPWSRTWSVLRRRKSWPWIALVAVSGMAAVAWTVSSGANVAGATINFPAFTFWFAVQWSLGDSSIYLANALGHFGWVDTELPMLLHAGIASLSILLVTWGLGLARRRTRVVIVLLMIGCLTGPVVIQSLQALQLGPVWQGRYFLPAMVGLPILGAFAIRRATLRAPGRSHDALAARALLLASAGWAALQLVAFVINLHRYTAGAGDEWFGSDEWAPPLGTWTMIATMTIGLAVLVLALTHTSTESRPGGPADVGGPARDLPTTSEGSPGHDEPSSLGTPTSGTVRGDA